MRIRLVNKTLLRMRIKEQGLEVLAVKSKCSASLLQKMASNTDSRSPSIKTIDGLCFATGDSMEELFPICKIDEKAS